MKLKSILVTVLCMVLVCAVSVFGTLAYLTSSASVTNTFTIGKVSITLDEAKVNEYGKPLDATGTEVNNVANADRVTTGNAYKLVPGMTYTKDPTITVAADGEEAYVRALVTVNCMKEWDAIFATHNLQLTDIFTGYDPAVWKYIDSPNNRDDATNTVTYEFRYYQTVDTDTDAEVLKPVFTGIAIPGALTGTETATLEGFEIKVVGHAIQAAGFDDADAAWAAFDAQNP